MKIQKLKFQVGFSIYSYIVLCPGWVDTSIRERHVVETQKTYDKKNMLSIEECVHKSLLAIGSGKREERFGGM